MEKKQPFCISLGDLIIITIFNNEIAELQNYAEDVGDPLWYIMGTDAWIELQETETKPIIVARNYEKIYFNCLANDEIIKQLRAYEECGILVMSSSIEFTEEYLLKELTSNPLFENVSEWINSSNKDIKIVGLMFCYYTKEIRKKYHAEDYID